MKSLYLNTLIIVGLLAIPVFADNDGPGVSGGGGGINNAVTSSYGDGGYVHVNPYIVEELEARIARLQEQLDDGNLYYGNSKVPLPNAIKQTKRQLAYWLGQRAQGINVPPGTKIPNNAPIPACSGSLYC